MSYDSENTVADGFVLALRGMNGFLSPHILKVDAFAKAVNVTFRGGLIKTRPGFRALKLLGEGTFKGAGVWSLNSGDFIAFVIGNAVYVYDIEQDKIYNFQDSIQIASETDKVYFTQVDRWLVIQDSYNTPWVLDTNEYNWPVLFGSAPPEVCLVPGTVGVYAHGRYHYVPTFVPLLEPSPEEEDVIPLLSNKSGKMGFVSSDIRDALEPEKVFKMTEHRTLNEGGHIVPPAEIGFIHGMSVFRNAATGTGLGALILLGREGVCAFDTSIPRDQWKSVNIGQPLFKGAGTFSSLAVVNVNNDIFYLDTESYLRSIRYDSSNITGGQSLANIPLSAELAPFVQESSKEQLPYASMAFCDNRLFFTLGGVSAAPFSFRGIAPLDLANLYAWKEVSAPVYDGLWTGFDFLQVLSARKAKVKRLFALVRQNERVWLLELDENAAQDLGQSNIEAFVITRYLNFNSLFLKRLRYCDIWLDQIRTSLTVELYYRPSTYPYWQLMGRQTLNLPDGQQVLGTPTAFRKLRFSLDTNIVGCDTLKEWACNGHEFQFMIKWQGYGRILRFQAVADVLQDRFIPVPDTLEINQTGLIEDDFAYRAGGLL